VAAIKSAVGDLETASHAMSEALYKSAAGTPGGEGGAQASGNGATGGQTADDDAIDAEFEVKS
jgi:molecular chaperone DnaK